MMTTASGKVVEMCLLVAKRAQKQQFKKILKKKNKTENLSVYKRPENSGGI